MSFYDIPTRSRSRAGRDGNIQTIRRSGAVKHFLHTAQHITDGKNFHLIFCIGIVVVGKISRSVSSD